MEFVNHVHQSIRNVRDVIAIHVFHVQMDIIGMEIHVLLVILFVDLARAMAHLLARHASTVIICLEVLVTHVETISIRTVRFAPQVPALDAILDSI